jgi:hypothetical protein
MQEFVEIVPITNVYYTKQIRNGKQIYPYEYLHLLV